MAKRSQAKPWMWRRGYKNRPIKVPLKTRISKAERELGRELNRLLVRDERARGKWLES